MTFSVIPTGQDSSVARTPDRLPGALLRALSVARSWVDSAPAAFSNDDEVLEAGGIFFGLASACANCTEPSQLEEAETLATQVQEKIHQTMSASLPGILLVDACHQANLSKLEIEVFLLLTLGTFGLLGERGWITDLEDTQNFLRQFGVSPLNVARALSPGSRLVTSGLIQLTEVESPLQSRLAIPIDLVLRLWHQGEAVPWRFRDLEDACDQLRRLIFAARRQMKRLEEDEALPADRPDRGRMPFAIRRLMSSFRAGLSVHPDWPLTQAIQSLEGEDAFILLLLIGRDAGHLPPDHRLFRGHGLSASFAEGPRQTRKNLARLTRNGVLRSKGWIRICGGVPPGGLTEDEALLLEAEFELSSSGRSALGVKRRWTSRTGRLRQPNLTMARLVLEDEARTLIDPVIEHAKNPRDILENWGVRSTIPYGNGTTLLFTGPPGVGKTATAEAIAGELGLPILVVDASAVQSCWSGETEKNIVRTFREAADEDAVLFWDEADSFFFNRDAATKPWEVREVNVLLQEIEAYPGVCILATNREPALDPALQRRICQRVAFRRPTSEMSSRIWRLLMPEKMPLDRPIDYERLGRLALTGGEIKNALFRAARTVRAKGKTARVSLADLLEAAMIETGLGKEEPIGFSNFSSSG